MTVPSNLSSTRFSSLAPTQPAERPSAANNPSAAAQTRGAAGQAQPSLPTGLVGHHVNTTA
ncbi:hypothetical protein [Paraburkholderia aromaticivorans]|uniref:Uncharacterized protein n=1 Tax=Paraburkholderia aromaticivorans TaxID=2026199 RepID=A0A248VHB6_9BURK|nr:hypothetical protein [Paraburkholderia aromaticivorans]ASV97941.1 hypothetical protein CJU94_07010 [Paraburkholderia aromaticivorans]